MSVKVDTSLIREKRISVGYTQEKMAEILGIADKSMYNRREKGTAKFQATELPLISQALKIPYEDLFTQNVAKTETNNE